MDIELRKESTEKYIWSKIQRRIANLMKEEKSRTVGVI